MAGLLSPPASAASPSPSHANAHDPNGGLPTPRQHPLRPGSEKEIALMNYLDKKILHMSRRYGKKFTEPEDHDDSPGYTNMDQVVADAHDIFQLAWISGTRKLHTFVDSPNEFVRDVAIASVFVSCCYSSHAELTLTQASFSTPTDLVSSFAGRNNTVIHAGF